MLTDETMAVPHDNPLFPYFKDWADQNLNPNILLVSYWGCFTAGANAARVYDAKLKSMSLPIGVALSPAQLNDVEYGTSILYDPLFTPRSSGWAAVRKAFLEKNPDCAVCGRRNGNVPHHVKPFHLHPEDELKEANLITLCLDHHLWFGHYGSWSSFNAHVREDAKSWLQRIENRPKGAVPES